MTERKVFTLSDSSVVDQLGWDYTSPVIVIWNVVKSNLTESALTLDGDLNEYKKTEKKMHSTLTYSANFWGSQKQYNAGLSTRPLGYLDDVMVATTDEDGEIVLDSDGEAVMENAQMWTTSFKVEESNLESPQVDSESISEDDKDLLKIQFDITRRFG